ncbi:MAG: hypothetical protein ACPL3C_04995, partial [Pyrobaculum sp.]
HHGHTRDGLGYLGQRGLNLVSLQGEQKPVFIERVEESGAPAPRHVGTPLLYKRPPLCRGYVNKYDVFDAIFLATSLLRNCAPAASRISAGCLVNTTSLSQVGATVGIVVGVVAVGDVVAVGEVVVGGWEVVVGLGVAVGVVVGDGGVVGVLVVVGGGVAGGWVAR